MTRAEFESFVARALETLPRRFRAKLRNLVVVVEDRPDPETLEEMGVEPPDTLYGLYRGVDLPHRDASYGNVLPDAITIYQGPIEADAADDEEMAELIRDVVVHEIGHYFGLDDEAMAEFERQEEE